MKVVHILHELKFSGAEIMYVDAAPLFQTKGVELMVVANAPELGEFAPYFERAGYRVFHKPIPSLRNYASRIIYYLRFIKFIKAENIDVVHTHTHSSMWGMALCARLAGKKSIFTFHNVFKSSWYSNFYHRLLRWSAKNILKSKFQTIGNSVYDNELNVYCNKTIKIDNWYGSNRLYPAQKDEKIQVRKELDISDDTLVLISIGGCSHVKRHYEIIKALPLIIQEIPKVLYLHLGSGETETEEKELAKELSLTENIRFYGNQQDVRKFLIVSDIYLMPSTNEGMPITTIETMGCKIPTILYDVPGLRDFNNNGENSILIPEDYKVLAERVIYLYNYPEERARIANNAKKMVDENYNMKINASKIYELYI